MAALTLAGFGINALKLSLSESGAPYATGYNDDFWKYAMTGGKRAPLPFQQVRAGGGEYVRQMIDWRIVQPNPFSRLDFSHYDSLRRLAKESGLRVLPHFVNCCPEFSAPESSGEIRYPSPERYSNFGGFVAAAMDYFDEVADTAEVWNEPNLAEFGALPPQVFAALVRASCDAIDYYEGIDAYSSAKRVVSGGLSVRGDWLSYQRSFLSEVGGRAFDFGLHSYDFRSFEGWDADELADTIATGVLRNVDAATNALKPDQRVWLTEIGVSAKQPLGRSGQARVLTSVADGLRGRRHCGAMIVHRLYPNPRDPDERPPTSAFFETAVFDAPYGTPEEAYFELSSEWGGAV